MDAAHLKHYIATTTDAFKHFEQGAKDIVDSRKPSRELDDYGKPVPNKEITVAEKLPEIIYELRLVMEMAGVKVPGEIIEEVAATVLAEQMKKYEDWLPKNQQAKHDKREREIEQYKAVVPVLQFIDDTAGENINVIILFYNHIVLGEGIKGGPQIYSQILHDMVMGRKMSGYLRLVGLDGFMAWIIDDYNNKDEGYWRYLGENKRSHYSQALDVIINGPDPGVNIEIVNPDDLGQEKHDYEY